MPGAFRTSRHAKITACETAVRPTSRDHDASRGLCHDHDASHDHVRGASHDRGANRDHGASHVHDANRGHVRAHGHAHDHVRPQSLRLRH